MAWLTWLQHFDSSAWILQILDQHWLVLGFAWGLVKIIAKRTKTTADDEIVELVEEMRDERAAHHNQD